MAAGRRKVTTACTWSRGGFGTGSGVVRSISWGGCPDGETFDEDAGAVAVRSIVSPGRANFDREKRDMAGKLSEQVGLVDGGPFRICTFVELNLILVGN